MRRRRWHRLRPWLPLVVPLCTLVFALVALRNVLLARQYMDEATRYLTQANALLAQQQGGQVRVPAARPTPPTCRLWLGDPDRQSPMLTIGDTATWCDNEGDALQWLMVRCHVDAGTALIRLVYSPLGQADTQWAYLTEVRCTAGPQERSAVTPYPLPAQHQLVVTIAETQDAPRMLHMTATRICGLC